MTVGCMLAAPVQHRLLSRLETLLVATGQRVSAFAIDQLQGVFIHVRTDNDEW